MKYVILTVLLAFVPSWTSAGEGESQAPKEAAMGGNGSTTYSGVLKKVYLPKDELCHAISAQGKLIVLRGKYKNIDDGLVGKEIMVTGVLKQQRLPMFILDEPTPKKNEAVPQGMPVPPGTEIEKESVFYVIENPEWKLKD